ncbi:MAG: hypothetical protein H7Y43_06630 [Akkermansiaceae bacterium]|nr:hypothetical protein [Verrucomicrobiales bacterium]
MVFKLPKVTRDYLPLPDLRISVSRFRLNSEIAKKFPIRSEKIPVDLFCVAASHLPNRQGFRVDGRWLEEPTMRVSELRSIASEPDLMDLPCRAGNEVAQRIGGIIAAKGKLKPLICAHQS